MPLIYDDTPGSWEEYSRKWPRHDFKNERACSIAFILCSRGELVPYGSYVRVGNVMRCETRKQLRKIVEVTTLILRHIKELAP